MPSSPTSPRMRGGAPLHHIDSFGLRGEEEDHWHDVDPALPTLVDDALAFDQDSDGHRRQRSPAAASSGARSPHHETDAHADRAGASDDEGTLHSGHEIGGGDPEKGQKRTRRIFSEHDGSGVAKEARSANLEVEAGAGNGAGDRLHRAVSKSVPAGERKWKDNIVGWDSKDDPANPKNWSFRYKYMIVVLLGSTTMCSTFASSIFSAASTAVGTQYGIGSEAMVLGTSLFILGYVPGPILWAPMSEMYGRRIVFLPMLIFICFSAATATAKDIQTIFITRFWAGLFASAPVTTVGGALADLFDQRERGTAVVFYSLAVVAGPTLSPLIGAALTEVSWRWTEYVVVIVTSIVLFLGIVVFRIPETYAPVILTKKASRLRYETNRWELHSRHEMNDFSVGVFLEKTLTLPLRLIAFEPMVAAITVYNSFAYGILYLLFGAVPIVFGESKGWTPVQSALPFLAVLVGTLCAAAINLLYSMLFFGPYLDRHGGSAKPEMRLPTMMLGGLLFPAGFFLLGWAPTAGQLVGLVFIGASFLLIFQSGINYLIDAYTIHSASAVASNTFMRSIFAFGLPFAAQPLFNQLGVGGGCSVLGGIACGLGFVPFIFFAYGERLRAMSRFAKKDDESAGMKKA